MSTLIVGAGMTWFTGGLEARDCISVRFGSDSVHGDEAPT
jgi:hypothetical protein